MSAQQPLSAADEALIDEYERIAAFADQVMAGTHPRVQIPYHLRPTAQAAQATTAGAGAGASAALPPSSPPPQLAGPATAAAIAADVPPSRPVPAVNPAYDYYKDLGVQPHVSLASIENAYKAKMELYGPDAPAAQRKYASANPNVVRQVKSDCFKVNRAYTILSDPVLRQEYDRVRVVSAAAGSRDNVISMGRGRGRGRGGRGRGGRRG